MKNLFFFCLLLLAYKVPMAQKQHFIYLETENQNPFYVRMGDNVFSSLGSGYLILSNLIEDRYTLFVGFPSLNASETKFTLNIGSNDKGYLIRSTSTGITLVDIQSSGLIKPVQELSNSSVTYQAQTDAFTTLLSKASGDSSLMFVPIFAKEEKKNEDVVTKKEKDEVTDIAKVELKENDEINKKEDIKKGNEENTQAGAEDLKKEIIAVNSDNNEIKKPDTLVLAKQEKETSLVDTTVTNSSGTFVSASKQLVEQPDTQQEANALQKEKGSSNESLDTDTVTSLPTAPFVRSQVTKYSESSTSEGFGLVFFDVQSEQTDTIRLIIPNQKIVFTEVKTEKVAATPESGNDSVKKEENKVEVPVENKSETAREKSTDSKSGSAVTALKSQCADQASENDFFKLRRDMAARETDEGMVEESKKYFRNKCFTTEQIRYLSALFLTSAGKYQFFDAAYLHVSDQEEFKLLGREIKDEYYLRRFKALIGE